MTSRKSLNSFDYLDLLVVDFPEAVEDGFDTGNVRFSVGRDLTDRLREGGGDRGQLRPGVHELLYLRGT